MKPTRRNVAHISQDERDKLVNAIVQIDMNKFFSDNVSYWDKQDQIHQGTHVHGGPAFVPWHREICNRFEAMLQEIDPTVALHYWDWTTDPTNTPDGAGGFVNLFTSSNFGSSSGRADTPFDSLDNGGESDGSREDTGNPEDPPQEITRSVAAGAPSIDSDDDIITAGDGLAEEEQWTQFREALESAHDTVHGHIGGTIGDQHSSFEDPFVFILHSNVDRLWAMWQMQAGYEWRLDPDQTYGSESEDEDITEYLEPWSGTVHFGDPITPWVSTDPDNEIVLKNCKDPSVVQPPCYDTLSVSVELQSPSGGGPITFNDIPEGTETVRAAVFSIRQCDDITLEITSGPGADFGTPLGATVTVPYTIDQPATGYVWISYRGTTAGASHTGSVTIRCPETEEEWTIDITANTVEKLKIGSMLILDKSGSMAEASGITGQTRLDVLKWAAPNYVQLLGDEDGIGIVSFDQDAYPVMSVTAAGAPVFGAGRATALAAIAAHDEDGGSTSIGDGLDLAHETIDPVSGYDEKALVVFSDGLENTAQYIADVADLLTERVFAIGLGRAEQLDVAVLDTLTSGSGGYLLITGDLGVDDQFRLSKYFLQILAGVTNAAIVVDPESWAVPRAEYRIPFALTGADFETDVILLSPEPGAFNFLLETPEGKRITPADAGANPAVTYAAGQTVHFYRLTLPVPAGGTSAHAGTWHAILAVDEKRMHGRDTVAGVTTTSGTEGSVHGVAYSLSVHARSNVRMSVYVVSNSHEPGAEALMRAVITESDLALQDPAIVYVVMTQPDGTSERIRLTQVSAGIYEEARTLALPGVYQLHFTAEGSTRRDEPFTREELRTVGIAYGADTPRPHRDDGSGTRKNLCRMLTCLSGDKGFVALSKKLGIDLKRLQECLCAEKPKGNTARLNKASLADTHNHV